MNWDILDICEWSEFHPISKLFWSGKHWTCVNEVGYTLSKMFNQSKKHNERGIRMNGVGCTLYEMFDLKRWTPVKEEQGCSHNTTGGKHLLWREKKMKNLAELEILISSLIFCVFGKMHHWRNPSGMMPKFIWMVSLHTLVDHPFML
jgi:hypothetical protein